ncbi:GntR family transcriptional regulator [Brachybacterium ginsengisoli]|uniref:GntR family transcriptional regulator n=1 Tax=Brachybacterium ginsengisoli TaxID=1331682 RepID=A0A291H098_9MICO|nr:GntR family transcriptional regulator [Brachybacterium ginsengisoli]ATG55887.1 GntR family transcriptional regulator [Brachybacterium ginsengisoli]
MPDTPSIRVGSLGDRLAQNLRIAIIRGDLAPGSRLIEGALASEYDLSRGPVRDALRVLIDEHLVLPERKGYRVRGISEADVDELYGVRGALEALVIRSLSDAEEPIDWTEAERALKRMRQAADVGDWYEFARHDLGFHTSLYRLGPNRRAESMWNRIEPTFAVVLQQTNRQDVDLHPSMHDHAQLLDAVREGRVDDALEYLEEHLNGSRRRMKIALTEPRR